jgi:hypothetical protein
MEKIKEEPALIKAGDTRLKLGHSSRPPLVDCRVLIKRRILKYGKQRH